MMNHLPTTFAQIAVVLAIAGVLIAIGVMGGEEEEEEDEDF